MLHNSHFFVLNYHPMKRNNLNSFAALILLALLVSACSVPPENSSSTNTNAPQQANSNSSSQPQIAQNNPPAPAPAPGSVPLALPSLNPAPAPIEKPAANARIAPPPRVPSDPNARVPKLVVPEKKIDFGKQPKEKTLVRAITIKNGGRADLSIESVVPS